MPLRLSLADVDTVNQPSGGMQPSGHKAAIDDLGQGLVMAPLSGAVLSTVRAASAGSGSGMYGTTAQIANGAGVAAIGALYFAVGSAGSARIAVLASFAACALSVVSSVMFLTWMRRAAEA